MVKTIKVKPDIVVFKDEERFILDDNITNNPELTGSINGGKKLSFHLVKPLGFFGKKLVVKYNNILESEVDCKPLRENGHVKRHVWRIDRCYNGAYDLGEHDIKTIKIKNLLQSHQMLENHQAELINRQRNIEGKDNFEAEALRVAAHEGEKNQKYAMAAGISDFAMKAFKGGMNK